MKKRIAAVIVMGLLLVALVAGVALAESWCDTIVLSKTTGPPGAAVNVYGFAYEGSSVSLLFDGAPVGSASADQYDHYSVDFNVPSDATPGTHEVKVVIEYEGTTECPMPFVVEAMATAPAAESPGAKPLVVLPETGFVLVPAGMLLAGGLGLFVARRKRG